MKLALIQKIRHGAIWQAMRERGWTQRQLADYLGIREESCGCMLAFKWIPANPEVHTKLMELTNIAIDDLFPPELSALLKDVPTTQEQLRDVEPQQLRQAITRLALPSAEATAMEHEDQTRLHSALHKVLSPKEYRIVSSHFGLDGHELTYGEIGQKFGVSRERVRQIAAQALRKLKHPRFKTLLAETPISPVKPETVTPFLAQPEPAKPTPKKAPTPKKPILKFVPYPGFFHGYIGAATLKQLVETTSGVRLTDGCYVLAVPWRILAIHASAHTCWEQRKRFRPDDQARLTFLYIVQEGHKIFVNAQRMDASPGPYRLLTPFSRMETNEAGQPQYVSYGMGDVIMATAAELQAFNDRLEPVRGAPALPAPRAAVEQRYA